jgi:glycosyltransferase involved in cell wall biosynthesis
MNILHINTVDNVGGAARAAYRLHTGLRRLGQDSSMFVAQCSSNDPTVRAFTPSTDLPSFLYRHLRQAWIMLSFARYRASRPAGYKPFSDDRTQHGDALLSQLPSCDVINLHWIAWFVDYQSFFARAPLGTPIVWTLHDMNPFTGGCHYDDGCGKYLDRCGACPQLGSNNQGDLSHQIWQRKRRIFEQIEPGRLHVVTPSRWLAGEARRSSLFARFSVSVIPYGLDIHVFSPRDRLIARDALKIPQDASVILFAAQSVGNRRRGFTLLAQVLVSLNDLPNLFLVSLGSVGPAINVQVPHLHLGTISGNDRLLSLIYSAADLFVIPSLQDNLPNTVLESLACGTPVVGFNVGGIPDMVRPGVTGLLAPAQDVAALRAVIIELLQDPTERSEMSANCRRIAIEEYALEVQAHRYVELYETMVCGRQTIEH